MTEAQEPAALPESKLRSMTGYGRVQADSPAGQFTVTLKSVNGRFQEIKVHLPPTLAGLETALRNLLKKEIRRGKVECRVRFAPAGDQTEAVRFNPALIKRYLEQLRSIGAEAGLGDAVELATLLRLPGAIEPLEPEADEGEIWPALRLAVAEALEPFQAERAREGNALASHLADELATLRSAHAQISEAKDQVVERYRERLTSRIAEIEEQVGGKVEPGRLEFEVAMYADKCDISEEMVRLDAHLDRLEQLIANPGGEPAGKPLDFLIQEIMREVNTTASKMRELKTVSAVLEMKAAVERIREQIQNIE